MSAGPAAPASHGMMREVPVVRSTATSDRCAGHAIKMRHEGALSVGREGDAH